MSDVKDVLSRLLQRATLTQAELETLPADAVEAKLIEASRCDFETSVAERMAIFTNVYESLKVLGITVEPSELWSRHLPLAELLRAWSSNTRALVGIVGVPGTGKSVLARILSVSLNCLAVRTASVSLDDFYLTPAERQKRGLRWRAVPGSHDMDLLKQFIKEAKTPDVLQIPHYDTSAEKRMSATAFERPQLVILEGWFVGASVDGYEFVTEALDYLVYLDADLEWSHQSRLNRERRIREQSNGLLGLTEAQTEEFWREALLPGSIQFVLPLKHQADIVLGLDPSYHIQSVSFH